MKCYYCNKKAHASGTIAIGREMCTDHIEQYWSGLKLPKKKIAVVSVIHGLFFCGRLGAEENSKNHIHI